MTTTIDRTAPQAFIDLAEQTLKVGSIDRVFIGFEHLGADFPAPIGWLLGMHRVDEMTRTHADIPDTGNRMTVDVGIGEEPSAFAGLGQDYLDAEEISQWIAQPRHADAGPSIIDVGDVDRVITAVRNGWAVTREIVRLGQNVGITYTFEAGNHFFNHEGSPSHRSTGAPISRRINLVCTVRSHALENAYAAFVDGTGVATAAALKQIAEQAPWYAPVAYFDDENEEWIR